MRWPPIALGLVAATAILAGAIAWTQPWSEEPSTGDDAASLADVNGDGHRRILLIGDSLTERAIDAYDATFTAHGVEAQYRGYTNTGLLTQLPEDGGATWWSSQLQDGLALFAPDAVVIESCCNYDGSYVGPDGVALPEDSPELYDRWAEEAEVLTEAVTATGVPVYWVLSPPIRPGTDVSWPPSRIERFNEIYESLDAPVIDWRDAFAEAEETSTEDLHDPDGVHFSDAGKQVAVAETWRVVTDQ